MLALTDIVPLRICAFRYPAIHPLAGRTGVDLAFAVRHPDGVGLYDTGFGRGHAWVDEVFDPKCDDIRDLMRAKGTPGHQSLAIETTSGIAVLAGHAVFSVAEWRGDAPPMETSDDSRRSADRLRALDPVAVFFAHDDAVWRRTVDPEAGSSR